MLAPGGVLAISPLYDTLSGLLLALALGVLIGLPQLLPALRYVPRSVRAKATAADKQAIGSLHPWRLLQGLVNPWLEDQPDGVFYPEASVYIGWLGLLGCLFAGWSAWWLVLGLSSLLAMGRHTPLFRWTAPLHLRIPARYCYFVSLALAFISLKGWQSLQLSRNAIVVILLLQAWDLIMNTSRLWPMRYTQRWERPSDAFNTPLTRYLQKHLGNHRVAGLPFPLTTGQLHGFRTLGYNGGSQARWMAHFRGDTDPNGGGGHDLFAYGEEPVWTNWYGVKYACTHRLLGGQWRKTPIPHLWENTAVEDTPTFAEVARRYSE